MHDLQPARPGRPVQFQIRLTDDEKARIQRASGNVEPSVWARAVLLRAADRAARRAS